MPQHANDEELMRNLRDEARKKVRELVNGHKKERVAQRMKKTIAIIAILIFGVSCFVGGFFYSNFSIKRKEHERAFATKEYERDFIVVVDKINRNTGLCVKVLDSVSETWSGAIQFGFPIDSVISGKLSSHKESLDKIRKLNNEIEMSMQRLKDYPVQYKEAHNTLMELYGVYNEIYHLTLSPSGSLATFNKKITDLVSSFVNMSSKLKIYMPKIEKRQEK